MSLQTVLVVVAALSVGLGIGFFVARARWPSGPGRAPGAPNAGSADGDEPLADEDTKPTLVPFRTPREAGRNLASVAQDRAEIDAILSDLDPDAPKKRG